MACRLLNLHATQPLRIDLRGGQALTLAPGARSTALREEWLYDNHNLAEWERAGWVQRLPARMAEVGVPDALPAIDDAAAEPSKAAAADDAEDADEPATDAPSGAASAKPKTPTRKSARR